MSRFRVLAPLLAAAACGCVTASKFQTEQSRADSAEVRLAQTKKDLEASRKAGEELQIQLKTTADQLASVQKSNADLQESLEANKGALSKKIADVVKEKDALAQKLADSAVESAGLRRDLAKAAEERKTIEDAKQAELDRVKKSYEDLNAGLKAEIAAGEVKLTQLKGRLTVNMVDRVLFDSGMADVRPEGRKVLERVGAILNNVKDKDIRIEGHTDNKPIVGGLSGRYPTNWELSTARATSVARYLQDHAKVDPKRLVAAGYGEFRPVAPNDTPENRALNRRIEIVLVARGE